MEASTKPNYKTTYHKDGTVSYWDVFSQSWERSDAAEISDRILASMSQPERDRIAKMATA